LKSERQMRRSLGFLLILTTCLGAARPCLADERDRQSAFVQGRKAIEAERWEDALVIYRKLWAERRAFDVALQLGLVEFNLRKYRDAAEHLAFGIRTLPPTEAQAAERAKKLLALAEREVAKLEIIVNRDNAEVRIDGAPVGHSPLQSEAYVDPGAHRIEAVSDAHAPVEKLVQAKAGDRQHVNLAIAELPTTPEPPPVGAAAPQPDVAPLPPHSPPVHEPNRRSKNMLPIYVAGGAAAVGIGVGATFLAIAGGKDSDKDEALARLAGTQPCARNTPHARECETIRTLAKDARTYRVAGAVALGAGVLAAGTAVVLAVSPDAPPSARARVPRRAISLAVLPQLGPRETGVSLLGQF
jgi:hypothetical protein